MCAVRRITASPMEKSSAGILDLEEPHLLDSYYLLGDLERPIDALSSTTVTSATTRASTISRQPTFTSEGPR